MLRLMLLRHAKSSWVDASLTDRERPLAGRGRKAAAAMGLFMASKGYAPRLILCSPARRARQTLELVAPAFKRDIDTRIEQELYDFGDGSAIIEVVRSLAYKGSPVAIIAHNPAMEGAALCLCAPGLDEIHERMADKYPTAALAVIDFDIDHWRDLKVGTGQLKSFTTPRDIGT